MTSIPLRQDRTRAPLSRMQQAMWRAEMALPGTALHNESAAFRLRGRLDPDGLEQALAALTSRFEVLRCSITKDGEGQPWQHFRDRVHPEFTRVDLSGLPASQHEQRLAELVRRNTAIPFDLVAAPLLRTSLFTLSPGDAVLLFTAHHLIADAWALGVFLAALGEAYTAGPQGDGAPPAVLSQPDFGDYTCWQRDQPDDARALAYWRQRLANAPGPVAFPAHPPALGQRSPVTGQSIAGSVHHLTMPATLTAQLGELGRAHLASPATVMLTIFCAVLGRFAGCDGMTVGIPVATRNQKGLSTVVGPLLNILACPVRQAPTAPFHAALREVREGLKADLRHRHTPLDLIREQMGAAVPFNVMYAFHNGPATNLSLPGVRSTPVPAHSGTAKYDLSLFARPRESGGLDITIEYRPGRLAAPTVAGLADALMCFARAAVQSPERTLADLPVLGDDERRRIVGGFNRGADAPVPGPGISERLRAVAGLDCDAAAVIGGENILTRAGVNECADRVAHRLQARHGVGPGDRVAVRMRRDAHVVPVIVGIWRAGAVLVPLDQALPTERAAHMLRDSGATLLIAGDRTGIPGAADLPVAHPSELVAPVEADPGLPPAAACDPPPDALAYLMYTSGSTGHPKGVAVPHRCLAALVNAVTHVPGLGPADVLVAVTSLTFDISMLELFAPLVAGGQVVVATEQACGDPDLLAALLSESGATVMQATPTLWRGLLDTGWSSGPRLRAFSGGEALDPALAERMLTCCAEVWNLYGPTETTVWSTAGRLRPGEPVTVGRPIHGTRCYVLDAGDQPVPCGVIGELVIGGAGVSTGYWGQPELTAASFTPDPIEPGTGTVYRTGDLAQYLPDGRIMLHGRADHQIKIHGHRVELGEIEALLSAHPQVRQAAVVLAAADQPGPRLVAFVTTRPGTGTVPTAELRRHLLARLPRAAVPAEFVALGDLPATTSGKVDRSLLARLARAPAGHSQADPPQTDAEHTVARIWAEVTGAAAGSVGRSDDFLRMGGNSLAATRLLGRVRAELHATVSLADFYAQPTVAALAALASQAGASPVPGGYDLAPGGPVPVPLSSQQRPLWLHHQLQPDSPAFHLAARVELTGPLDPGALADALRMLCARHDVLAARCELLGAQPSLVPQPGAPVLLAIEDLRGLPSADAAARLAAYGKQHATTPFDLATGPLLRAALVHTGEARATLLVTAHHIAMDGWSVGVAVRELAGLYASCAGHGPHAVAPALGYTAYAAAQASPAQMAMQEQHLAYWAARLEGYSGVLDLPSPRRQAAPAAGRAVRDDTGAVAPAGLPAGLTRQLREVAARLHTTPFTVLLTVFASLIGRYSGTDDVVIGVPAANRDSPELEPLVGSLVNTLPVRVDLSAGGSTASLIAQTGSALAADLGCSLVPIDRLVSALALPRDLSRPALIQAVLVLQEAPPRTIELGGAAGFITPVHTGAAKYDLTLALEEHPDRISGELEYARAHFTAGFAQRFTRDFSILLRAALADPAASLDRVSLPGQAQLPGAAQLAGADRRAFAEPVHLRFQHHAAASSHQEAIRHGTERVSYQELDWWSSAIAARLEAQGIGPGRFVAVLLPAGPQQTAAILGVAKAGSAFVVLDPQDGDHRLVAVLSDAEPACVLADEALAAAHPGLFDAGAARFGGVPVLPVDARPRTGAAPVTVRVSGDTPLCLVYTSGTTGAPKGIVLPHATFSQFAAWQQQTFGIGAASRIAQWAPFTYDAAYTEVFAALSHGAVLCLPPDGARRDPAAIAAWLREEQITQIQTIPAFFQLVSDVAGTSGGLPDLRHVLLAGEVLPVTLAARWAAGSGQPRLHNLYGPTECILATHRELRPGEHFTGSVPIGLPIAGRQALVLDHRRRLCPAEVTGEIYLRSDFLAGAYHRRPSDTSRAYVPDPWRAGMVLYRTGDLGRWQADGELAFTGRRDGQVKIRGSRVELAEIEAVLEEHPLVLEAAATVHRDGAVARLCAYAVTRDGADIESLRAHLAERLPRASVPDAVLLVEGIPRTRSGKRDRARLPAPGAPASPDADAPPRIGLEQVVAGAWQDLLGTGSVGRNTNFFEAGGDSLLAARLQIELSRRLSREIRLVDLFARPTIAEFAAGLDADPPGREMERTRGGRRRRALQARASARGRAPADGDGPVAVPPSSAAAANPTEGL